jgi:hypothetical protein
MRSSHWVHPLCSSLSPFFRTTCNHLYSAHRVRGSFIFPEFRSLTLHCSDCRWYVVPRVRPTRRGRLSPLSRSDKCMILISVAGTGVHKRYDKLTGRLRAAEFTFNTLLARASELRNSLSNELAPPPSSIPKDHTPPSRGLPAPGPIFHSNPKLPKPSNPLPTPLPTPSADRSSAAFPPKLPSSDHSEPPSSSTDWTQRCTAYYAKRKLQEEAKKARQASHDNASPRQSSFCGSTPHARPQSFSSQPPLRASQPPPWASQSQPQPQPRLHPYERARTRDQMRKASVVVPAWDAYTRGWDLITSTLGSSARARGPNTPSPPAPDADADADAPSPPPPFLSMASIPWPVLRVPPDGEFDACDITPEDIREFLLSPYHSPDDPKDVRIREAYLRWHPDKASKWMASVIPSDHVRVKQAVDRVAWCLNQLK